MGFEPSHIRATLLITLRAKSCQGKKRRFEIVPQGEGATLRRISVVNEPREQQRRLGLAVYQSYKYLRGKLRSRHHPLRCPLGYGAPPVFLSIKAIRDSIPPGNAIGLLTLYEV